MSSQYFRNQKTFINREISWLDFNRRVLMTAAEKHVPLLERLKFVAIAASNLDEFYMVRVASHLRMLERDQEKSNLYDLSDGSSELIGEIRNITTELVSLMSEIFESQIRPALAEEKIVFKKPSDLSKKQISKINNFYLSEVHPILTPIAIDLAHPLPRLRNLSLNLALRIIPKSKILKKRKKDKRKTGSTEVRELFALVQVPSILPPYFTFFSSSSGHIFVALEDIISLNAFRLFPGHEIVESGAFRVTRASDLDLSDNEGQNILTSMQDILRQRERGQTIRLETSSSMSATLRNRLLDKISIQSVHTHEYPDFIIKKDLMRLTTVERTELRYPIHKPVRIPELHFEQKIFRRMREKDILLFHPYESFSHVVDFMEQAADDPDVVAIKQTFYRTSGDSPLVRALSRAAANGKQVTALVELKARFDEANNIQWAQQLEEEGVHVVYGLLGLKTHAKLALVIRREGSKLRRYLHLGTGNYNSSTARLYTDLSILTSNEGITKDAMLLFNVLTGYADLPPMEHLLVAPFNLREKIEEKIFRECEHARAGKKAHIIVKLNSIADHEIIEKLYEASRAGVKVELLVRGICCLRPGIRNQSENINVRSTIDRFLEHARVYWFNNDGAEELYLSSADWMPRNLNRRIEIAWPILDESIKQKILDDILRAELKDNSSGWILTKNGSYEQIVPRAGELPRRLQHDLIQATDQLHETSGRYFKKELATGHLSRLPRKRTN
ncbi:MAG: polyphosphate kinase 1 [Myxococcota bacterium]|nr:polyphosphate kinase 1 [Myxococcota bacterium]